MRASVFDDLLSLYKKCESLPQEYPLEMKFTAERAVDLGGVSRDVMTAFWQDACEKLFNGNKLLVPVVSPHIDLSLLTTIGKILSHGYLCTGYLPTQISFPSLAAMLLGPSVNIDFSVLIESFLDYVSDVERSVLKSAVEIAKHTSKTAFPSDVQKELLTVLCNYGCRQIPSPSTLSQIVADIALPLPPVLCSFHLLCVHICQITKMLIYPPVATTTPVYTPELVQTFETSPTLQFPPHIFTQHTTDTSSQSISANVSPLNSAYYS